MAFIGRYYQKWGKWFYVIHRQLILQKITLGKQACDQRLDESQRLVCYTGCDTGINAEIILRKIQSL